MEFDHYAPEPIICILRTSHLEPYRTSVTYFGLIFEAYRTIVSFPYTVSKKVYCTSVPYFLAKIEAHRTVLTYHTVPYCHSCF